MPLIELSSVAVVISTVGFNTAKAKRWVNFYVLIVLVSLYIQIIELIKSVL